jgi:light-regulated signal transduction histidine kinase (bacteriophytochrome)
VDASPHTIKPGSSRPSTTEEELQSFSYMVSHDLAASIRHLTEFSRMLVGEVGEGLTDRQRRHADQIRAAGDNCTTMLEQLLIFSRVQQSPLAKVIQDANATLHLPMLLLAAQTEAAGANITVEPLGEVYADKELLATAFVRLIDNAVKFGCPGVHPRVVVRAAHDKEFWRMQISDNGLGVEPAYREAAFRMFRRLQGTNAYSGVGAGLAICRRIARLHGGDAVFLDCDQGACVELSLPHEIPVVRSRRHH